MRAKLWQALHGEENPATPKMNPLRRVSRRTSALTPGFDAHVNTAARPLHKCFEFFSNCSTCRGIIRRGWADLALRVYLTASAFHIGFRLNALLGLLSGTVGVGAPRRMRHDDARNTFSGPKSCGGSAGRGLRLPR